VDRISKHKYLKILATSTLQNVQTSHLNELKMFVSQVVPAGLFALYGFLSFTTFAKAQSAPLVDLGYVRYTGSCNTTSGINYYRGIPYAQPPVGELRWRKPRAIEQNNSFNGQTIAATTIARPCVQGAPLPLARAFADPGVEDCLVLDVLVPMKPVSKRLPVLVEIHGGGYTLGSAQSAQGDTLVYASQGTKYQFSLLGRYV
jgi:hypothetical protein